MNSKNIIPRERLEGNLGPDPNKITEGKGSPMITGSKKERHPRGDLYTNTRFYQESIRMGLL